MTSTDDLGAARAAVHQGRWDEALATLARSGDLTDSAEGLELLATAEYGAGGHESAVDAWERLYALHLRLGEPVAAGRAGAMAAMFILMDSGLMAPVRGWLARVDRLLTDAPEGPVHALVAMTRTYERFISGDLEAARQWAGRAIDLGTRHDVLPAQVLGRTAAARIQLFDGEVAEGLDALDALATLLLSGEVDPLTCGMMMCELVCAAQGLAQYDKAEEWTAAYEALGPGGGHFGSMGGRCRLHRAQIQRLRGDVAGAEIEATRACDELRPWLRREFGWPLSELGAIRLRRGDLAGAEQAFVAAHACGWEPQPGLAQVRFLQGQVDAAVTLINEALERPLRIPSKERPPIGGLTRAPLLEVQVEVALAAGDVASARAAATELAEIAAIYQSVALTAGATLASGRVALAEGRHAEAVHACRSSVEAWCQIGAPFEAAAARLVLAAAHDGAGETVLADAERSAAASGFTDIGAVAPTVAAHQVARDVVARGAASPEPAAVFRRAGDTRTVRYLGTEIVVRDLVGLRYLARLLSDAGREFHVLDLVAIEHGVSAAPGIAGEADPDLMLGRNDAGPMLDDQARRAYQRRLADIEEDIEDAERLRDPDRAELARRDRDYLVAELSRAFGLGGRSRDAGSTSERARTSVTRSIRYALRKLDEHHPQLAEHLTRTVGTGTYCTYAPDPHAAPAWIVADKDSP